MTDWRKNLQGILAAAIAVVAIMATGSASAAECMRFDAKAEKAAGELAIGAFQDAADRPESAFILSLSAPVCLDAKDPEFRVREAHTIHIYGVDDAVHKQIEALTGNAVSVRGRPFGAHTAHHHAPIVMEITEIQTR